MFFIEQLAGTEQQRAQRPVGDLRTIFARRWVEPHCLSGQEPELSLGKISASLFLTSFMALWTRSGRMRRGTQYSLISCEATVWAFRTELEDRAEPRAGDENGTTWIVAERGAKFLYSERRASVQFGPRQPYFHLRRRCQRRPPLSVGSGSNDKNRL